MRVYAAARKFAGKSPANPSEQAGLSQARRKISPPPRPGRRLNLRPAREVELPTTRMHGPSCGRGGQIVDICGHQTKSPPARAGLRQGGAAQLWWPRFAKRYIGVRPWHRPFTSAGQNRGVAKRRSYDCGETDDTAGRPRLSGLDAQPRRCSVSQRFRVPEVQFAIIHRAPQPAHGG